MAEAAGYTLDLYCDDPDHTEKAPLKGSSCDGTYYAQTYGQAKSWRKKPVGNIQRASNFVDGASDQNNSFRGDDLC